MAPIDDLKKARSALVALRRRQADKLANGGGELPTYGAGILNSMNWIAAVDRAIEDEEKQLRPATFARELETASAPRRAARSSSSTRKKSPARKQSKQ